jgi:hypothetical protein
VDVHHPARGLFGRCEARISSPGFDALVNNVMTTEPYASAQHVFWIADNGTIHRGQPSIDAFKLRGRTSYWRTSPRMPRGSTRSRSTSRS